MNGIELNINVNELTEYEKAIYLEMLTSYREHLDRKLAIHKQLDELVKEIEEMIK